MSFGHPTTTYVVAAQSQSGLIFRRAGFSPLLMKTIGENVSYT